MAIAKIQNVTVDSATKKKIRDNSPFALPLNPTAQGWSAQHVRDQLFKAICGSIDDSDVNPDETNLLNVFSRRVSIIKEVLEELDNRYNDLTSTVLGTRSAVVSNITEEKVLFLIKPSFTDDVFVTSNLYLVFKDITNLYVLGVRTAVISLASPYSTILVSATKAELNLEITKITDGTIIAKKAEKDKDGNVISTHYVSNATLGYGTLNHRIVLTLKDGNGSTISSAIYTELPLSTQSVDGLMSSTDKTKLDALPTKGQYDIDMALKVPSTRKILGIDLTDDILLGEFKTALGEATAVLSGLMSATDKSRLDALHALLGVESDADATVNTINEVLAIFNTYPEGADLVNALAGKVDKVAGKELSKNDFTDILKAKLDSLLSGEHYYDKQYIDALKDLNGWTSSLITQSALTNGQTVTKATLNDFDVIKLFAINTSTHEIDTDSFDTSIGLVDGYIYKLFDNDDITFTIGDTDCTFLTSAGYELKIIGQKYVAQDAENVNYDNTVKNLLVATNVQDAIDEVAEKTIADNFLSPSSEKAVQNKVLEPLFTKKYDKYISAYSHVPNPISSTFNGWLIPFSKDICNATFKSIKVILSLSPTTMDVKCILMDGNKNVLKYITKSCTNGQEEIFDLNWDIRDVSTDIYYIGLIGISDGETHLMIHLRVEGSENAEYVDIATPIENAYTTNKGASWSWMANTTNMSFKKMWFVAQIEKYKQAPSKDDTTTKEEVSSNVVLGKQNHTTINLFNIKTISPTGQWYAYTNGILEYYPNNIYIEHYCHSDFIEVEGSQDYAFSGGGVNNNWQRNGGICFFDEDKIFISGVAGGEFNQNSIIYTAPTNAKYIVINFSQSLFAQRNVQLEKGNVATAYQPYYGDLYYLNNLLIKEDQIEYVNDNNFIRCADSYDLVVGDTFELFYKGILEVFNYENYNILCQCDIGKCLTRKFVVDSITSAMVGNHTLQIIMYNNEMKQLDQKTITLNVHNVATSPSAEKVVLCIGDSLTAGGHWVDEFGRRLTKTTNTTNYGATAPAGLGLTNIKFIGKKLSDGGFGYEGYGGWTFANYLDTTGAITMYWLTVSSHDKDSSDQESIWEDANGVKWQLETIEASRLKFKKYIGVGLMPASGTLTWVSGGVHTSNIVFTSVTLAGGNPFVYNGAIDFEAYCADMGVSTIDEVYILLGWNDATTTTPSMTNCKSFIDLLRTFNPNIKVVLMGLQTPSLDGCGVNYGASGIYSRYMELVNYVHNLDDAYKGVTEDYVSGVYYINVSGQFDTEYNMPVISSTPNSRNPTAISIQDNGVHPAISGYYQIADVVYRWYNGNS